MIFYLGTHKACWLARTDVPLFVSRRTLAPMKTLPRALGTWALDSGGFTELRDRGNWDAVSPETYAGEVRRFSREIGRLEWAAIQDWMCEPVILARTGLTVAEHQRRTIASYLRLRELAPEIPWAPVLQGWTPPDYWRHVDAYRRAGIDLRAAPAVGVGSVCRRQGWKGVARLLATLAADGVRLHGFGLKVNGFRLEGAVEALGSADSLAWSSRARKKKIRLEGCPHETCANCMRFALGWRAEIVSELARAPQLAVRPQAFPEGGLAQALAEAEAEGVFPEGTDVESLIRQTWRLGNYLALTPGGYEAKRTRAGAFAGSRGLAADRLWDDHGGADA